MTTHRKRNLILRAAILAFALTFSFRDAAAQIDVGLGFAFANTEQNAVALGGTVTIWPGSLLFNPQEEDGWEWFPIGGTLRLIADAELGVRDFKEHFGWEEPERHQILDDRTSPAAPAWPNENDLWQMRGWEVHAAAYGTLYLTQFPFIHLGVGKAYNGLDRTSALSFIGIAYLAPYTELQIEFLDRDQSKDIPVPDFGGRWRARLVLDFWRMF